MVKPVMWQEVYFDTTQEHADSLGDELMALGASAITLHDAEDQPIYEPPPDSMPLWDKVKLVALFSAESDIAPVLAFLEGQTITKFHTRLIADQDWARVCLADFKPLQFGKRLWICPSWDSVTEPDAIVIALDPGLAFGTGTHATTRLCLEWLEAHIKPQTTVIDYGCGSGILSLAALKLGAQGVLAVDNDKQAILATKENARRNHIPAANLTTVLPEQLQTSPVNVLIANILAAPLISLAAHLASLILPNGYLVLSGILREQAGEVMAAYQSWITWQEPTFLDGWTRLVGTKQPAG